MPSYHPRCPSLRESFDRVILGLSRDYIRVYVEIMEKKMETTMVMYRGYIGIMENEMEATI